jgi:hypothetical protein
MPDDEPSDRGRDDRDVVDWSELLASLEPPVLILSTAVGRGMYYLGDAVRERFPDPSRVIHLPVEEVLPAGAVAEDVKRYRFISSRLTPLLYLIYKCPLFYYRKFVREKWVKATDLSALQKRIQAQGIRTVICISHRAAFWASCLKRRAKLDLALWDLLGEFGHNHGYRYLFWEVMNGFLSPVDRTDLRIAIPDTVRFVRVDLPARRAYVDLARVAGDRGCALLVCGYWGQGPIFRVVRELLGAVPGLTIHAVCGENERLRARVQRYAQIHPGVKAHGVVENLAPLLRTCGSVITKPGISTLVEAHAARRKIFLLRGMPVAEANNARHARAHFQATRYSARAFRAWWEGYER